MLSPIRGRWLAAAFLAMAFTACDRPSDLSSPGLDRQMATGDITTLRFVVTRADNGLPVPGTTVSVWFNNTQTNDMVPCDAPGRQPADNCWLTTDANGIAEISAVEGSGVGYLARYSDNWLSQANEIWPPAVPPATNGGNADLGALTCGRTAPVPANAGTIQTCFTQLYLRPRNVEVVQLALPHVDTQPITVLDPDGQIINSGLVYSHLVEALPEGLFPWLNDLPAQTFPGMLRYYAPGLQTSLPKVAGELEVYGKSSNGYDVAASVDIGTDGATVTAFPVVCTSESLSLDLYTLNGAAPGRRLNSEFHFPDGKWVYGAVRDPNSANPLDPNLTTTVVVLETAQTTTSPVTVSLSQRFRPSTGSTYTASATAVCTPGDCQVVSTSAPGAGNPMVPTLTYDAVSKRLIWIVTGLNDPAGISEWSVKATRQQGNRTIVLDQWPLPSKSSASSAFQIFSDALKTAYCDPRPEWSYDKSWGMGM